MENTEKVILTNMCMIYDDSGNVVVQNRVDKNWHGFAFPGGHVERGESFTDAVIREVYEETGLIVSELQMCGIKDWVREDGIRYIVHLYKTNKFEGELKSSDEGEVMWIPINKFYELDLAERMESYPKFFDEDKLSEIYFYRENGEWKECVK